MKNGNEQGTQGTAVEVAEETLCCQLGSIEDVCSFLIRPSAGSFATFSGAARAGISRLTLAFGTTSLFVSSPPSNRRSDFEDMSSTDSTASMVSTRVAGSAFEGLVIRSLDVDEVVGGKLRAVAFDIQRMETSYSVEVWRRAIHVAAAEFYRALSTSAAEFSLGSRMVNGYFQTLIGKVLQAGMPFLSADTLCMRLPRLLSTGVLDQVKVPAVSKHADKTYVLTMYGAGGVPHFTAAAIDATLRLVKVTSTGQVDNVNADSFSVGITWV